MVKIDSNQVIRLSKGDDVILPLFINQGTAQSPVRYTFKAGQGEEVYLYVFLMNTYESSDPLLFKTFKDNGNIVTVWLDGTTTTTTGNTNINENGDMLVRFQSLDTSAVDEVGNDLEAGEYRYQIRAKLIDTEAGGTDTQYKYNTVTNRNKLYLIEDDFSRVWRS